MEAVPNPVTVTRPPDETVATLVFDERHAAAVETSLIPSAYSPFAVSWPV
jgi:hypothetical protein